MLLSAERISARILHVFGAFRVNLNLLLVTMLLCLGVSSFFKQSGAPHGHICMCTTFSLWSLLCCCRVDQCNFASRMLWGVLGYACKRVLIPMLCSFCSLSMHLLLGTVHSHTCALVYKNLVHKNLPYNHEHIPLQVHTYLICLPINNDFSFS